MNNWSVEFYEDSAGRRPVEKWLDSLSDVKREAAIAAIQIVLMKHGLSLIGTKWLKALGGGVFEFRIRHSAVQIKQMYELGGYEGRNFKLDLLLRIFVTFHENQIVLLLGAYDKGGQDSANYQQKQIQISRKRFKEFGNRY